jgi:thiamine biosynthesis lipoprotein
MNELVSVTVYASDALTADAYDHAILAMGLTKGLQFVEAHPSLAAFFIYVDREGVLRDTACRQFLSLLNESKQCDY